MNIKTINKGKEPVRNSHKIRPIRISSETWDALYKIKRGTWEHTIQKLLKSYENKN